MPERIQRRRTRGWGTPQGAIYVGRGSIWENPYRIKHDGRWWWCMTGRGWGAAWTKRRDAHAMAAWCYEEALRQDPARLAAVAALRGHDLACWCPLDLPCHADVLLRLANA